MHGQTAACLLSQFPRTGNDYTKVVQRIHVWNMTGVLINVYKYPKKWIRARVH